ncbi:cation:proton antiporter [Haliea sp. AH-315-K21]|uniref:Potassium transporter n=1 Tax=SAR86 cluster bacterium TaxID=2030880 RepID=A0A2A5C951_9GAMM|nr:cation:proton antiporter [Haliea sp. AH-315-K21]PCJ39998.1 MAG: potassium transporter [SAR86 cluster bacterium]
MLTNSLIYLFAAVLSVPIAKKLGLGSVLGYLLAGVIIGPFALSLVGDQTDVMHFAEYGVIMMLFLIGLELQPRRLWQMRKSILGLGGLQVVFTSLLLWFLLIALTDLAWQSALVIGLAVALSSTAIVLQSLSEKDLTKTQAGTNAFSVLLFQDIAVIPILALLPLLAVSGMDIAIDDHSESLLSNLSAMTQLAVTLATIAGIIIAGRFLSSPIFRYIAATRLRELFTAVALLIVLAISGLMTTIGLSPALGAFLAGVVLADNEFRHQLEADIEPFKALLLGLFFITVGASINFALLQQNPVLILSLVLALFLVKFAVLFALSLIFKFTTQQGLLFSLALAQGGEFAFVLVSSANQYGVFSENTGSTLTLVVALSMLLAPLLFVLYASFISRTSQNKQEQADEDIQPSSQVIVAGFGRFGQIVGRLLSLQGFELTLLDHSPGQVEMVRRFDNTVFYGDAARTDLLAAAGAENAKLLIVAVDDADKSLQIIDNAKEHFPHMKILARAIDRRHAYQLIKRNIESFRRETFDSALHLGVEALQTLGISETDAKRAGEVFNKHDEETLIQLAEVWGDDKSYGLAVRARLEDLKQVLEKDQEKTKE